MDITNGIYLGKFPLLKFFGSFDWLEDRRRLEFDFDSIAVAGLKFDLPKGKAEEFGAATGLGSSNNVEMAKKGKKPFFNWISADDKIATARGGGGGLALWRRDTEMEAMASSPPTFMTPTTIDPSIVGDGYVWNPAADSGSDTSSVQASQPGSTSNTEIKRQAEWNPDSLDLPGCVYLKHSPEYLDGSLPGDAGFDPLCLAILANKGMDMRKVGETAAMRKAQMQSLSPEEQQRNVLWMREAELKHGRLAMLAAAGWPLAELWNSGALSSTNGRAPSVLNGHLSDYTLFLILVSLFAHAVEINMFDNTRAPGNLGFDPLGFYAEEGPTKQRELQLSEIKNGRLAMMAITGFALQELLWRVPVVKQTPFFFR
jgi:light-harvesting complex II chlorophyll a/b binding protein 4